MATIFNKTPLNPAQLRTVANRRFADAKCLVDTRENERANGAMYLSGFVIECLLKAKLLEVYPWLKNSPSSEGLSKADQKIRSLCYQKHDLDEILEKLPAVEKDLLHAEASGNPELLRKLKSICGTWTIFARYSPMSAKHADAKLFLTTVGEITPSWGASVIDGFEGMEGNGPNSGTPVPSRLAIASSDFVATDRIAAECMGIDPEWLGYVKYCGEMRLGQFNGSKIDVIGAKVADVKKAYRMHPDIDKELQWQGPMKELPFNLGWVRPLHGPDVG